MRYVDDIFIAYNDNVMINEVINKFNQSKLNFTIKLENNKTLPFLDVLIHREETNFKTSVYIKETNKGICLKGYSECTDQ